MNKLRIGLGLIASMWAISAFAAAPPALRESVAVCDPNNPQHCAAPDSSGNLPVTGTFVYTPSTSTKVSTTALAANLVVRNAAAKLQTFEVQADSTLSAAPWWVMIYDATSAPADGAVTPAKCYSIPMGISQIGGTFNSGGTSFTTGITIGVSTTGCFTKTASTHAAFISGDYQ